MLDLESVVKKRVKMWLDGDYDMKTKKEIERLQKENPQSLIDAFYKTLTFGTGGMRETMGIGTNRMNEYTVRGATQGIANYLKKAFSNSPIKVAIGYDSRINSKKFAETAAEVFSGNGIHVFLFDNLRPTPLVSFACRFKKCQAAVMITASHNPPEYNGYKVFWEGGAQVLPPHDAHITEEVAKAIDCAEIKRKSLPNNLVELIGQDVDELYFSEVEKNSLYLDENEKIGCDLKILYSNLHGTGITIVPHLLKRFGFNDISFVEEQKEPDGNFPFAKIPNPEEKEALELGINKLLHEKQDIFIATDPDCDRIGSVVLHQGRAHILTGNQQAAILAYAICEGRVIPKNACFVKSIVTTDLVRKIVESYGALCLDVLPGFRNIADNIQRWEKEPDGPKFIFGCEESCGYLFGTAVLDKDAASASFLLAEVALKAKREGKTLIDLLNCLYAQYGFFLEKLISLKFEEGKAGKEAQNKVMSSLRNSPPKDLAGIFIKKVDDYKNHLTPANVISYELECSSKVIIRPSGTEPKIKVYLMLSGTESDAKAQKLEKVIRDIVK